MSRGLVSVAVAVVLTCGSGALAGSEAAPGPAIRVRAAAGEGVTFQTPDELFELNVRARLMILTTVQVAGEGPLGADLSVRRARLAFSGSAFDRRLRYKLQLALAPADLMEGADGVPHRSPLLDASLDFAAHRDLSLRLGQFVLRHNRSRVVSSSSMQLVDRSIANAEFNLDRDLGLEASSNDLGGLGLFRYALSITVGEGRDSPLPADTGFIYLARFEVTPLGRFADSSEGDLARELHPRLAIGAAYAFSDRDRLDRTTHGAPGPEGATFSQHHLAADAAFVWQGLSLLAEVVWRDGATRAGPTAIEPAPAARDGWGGHAQLGYLLPTLDLELAARVGWLVPLGNSPLTSQREAGLGLNYYFVGHALKLQADLFQTWNDEAVLTPGAFADGHTRVRVMLQASF